MLNEEVDLFELFKVLWKRKWLIIVPILLVIILISLYFNLSPQKKYYSLELYTENFNYILYKTLDKKFNNSIRKYPYLNVKDFGFLFSKINYFIIIKKGIIGNRKALPEKRFVAKLLLKREKGEICKSKEAFLNDFLNEFDKALLGLYIKELESLELTYLKEIDNIKEEIKEIDRKINIIDRLKNTINKNAVFNSSDDNDFLSPEQQKYGYLVKKYSFLGKIQEYQDRLDEIQKIEQIIETEKVKSFESFRENNELDMIKTATNILVKFKENFKRQNLHEVKIVNSRKNYKKYLLIFSLLTMIFMMFIVVLVEFSKKEKI